jgi:hypothetical protein
MLLILRPKTQPKHAGKIKKNNSSFGFQDPHSTHRGLAFMEMEKGIKAAE